MTAGNIPNLLYHITLIDVSRSLDVGILALTKSKLCVYVYISGHWSEDLAFILS